MAQKPQIKNGTWNYFGIVYFLPAYSPILISSSKTSLKPSPELRRSRRPSMNYISVKRQCKLINISFFFFSERFSASFTEVTSKSLLGRDSKLNENTTKAGQMFTSAEQHAASLQTSIPVFAYRHIFSASLKQLYHVWQ